MSSKPHCAVCTETAALRGIIVAGAELFLCTIHQRKLGARAPKSFDELAAIVASPEAQRRSRPDRRRGERRAFPRPEGRRLNDGRRAGDA